MTSRLYITQGTACIEVTSPLALAPLPGQQYTTIYIDLTASGARLAPFGPALAESTVLVLPETASDFGFNTATGRVEWRIAGEVRASLPVNAEGLTPPLQLGAEGYRVAVSPALEASLVTAALPPPPEDTSTAPSLLYVADSAETLVLHAPTELRVMPGQDYAPLEIRLASPQAEAWLNAPLHDTTTLTLPEPVEGYTAHFDGDTFSVVVSGPQGPVLHLPVNDAGVTSAVRVGDGLAAAIEVAIDALGEVAVVSVPWETGGDDGDNGSGLLAAAQALSHTLAGVDTADFPASDDPVVAALSSEYRWLGDTLTYAFSESPHASYAGDDLDAWQPVDATARTAVHAVMAKASHQLGIEFVAIDDAEAAHFRFNTVHDAGKDFSAYAYYPPTPNGASSVYASIAAGEKPGKWGDIFLGSNYVEGLAETQNMLPIVHELGHALGLKHPFEGATTLPEGDNHQAHSVMSYTGYHHQMLAPYLERTGPTSYHYGYEFETLHPDQFMVYDLAALHHLYGTDTQATDGNNIHVFDDAPRFTTLWDAGGEDTLDLTAVSGPSVIDLTSGTYSSLDRRDPEALLDMALADIEAQAQAKDINADMTAIRDWFEQQQLTGAFNDLYNGEKALGIAHGTVIENVIGGDGGNSITDSAVDNALTGGSADDTFVLGAGGFDTVDGGGGFDTIDLSHLASLERSAVEIAAFTELLPEDETPEHDWLLLADTFAVAFSQIERIGFANPADDWLLA